MAITRADVGSWIVRCNPDEKWDYWQAQLEGSQDRGVLYPSDWSLGTTYRNELIHIGDLIVLYVGGQRNPGVAEIGVVTSGVYDDEWNPRYVVDQDERGVSKPFIKYDAVMLTAPVSRSALKSDPRFAGSELLRVRMAQNPLFFTPAETQSLADLIRPQDLQVGGWTGFANP